METWIAGRFSHTHLSVALFVTRFTLNFFAPIVRGHNLMKIPEEQLWISNEKATIIHFRLNKIIIIDCRFIRQIEAVQIKFGRQKIRLLTRRRIWKADFALEVGKPNKLRNCFVSINHADTSKVFLQLENWFELFGIIDDCASESIGLCEDEKVRSWSWLEKAS